MKNIYEAIVNQLRTAVPELKWIDLEKGQMNYPRPPVVFPAALIGISLPKTEDLNHTKQVCDAYVTVKICFDFTGNTSISTPEVNRLESLAYFDLAEKVYAKLQGWSTGEFNPLSRFNLAEELRPDGYKVIKISFRTSFHDFTAA